jgi:hypothetical protein
MAEYRKPKFGGKNPPKPAPARAANRSTEIQSNGTSCMLIFVMMVSVGLVPLVIGFTALRL